MDEDMEHIYVTFHNLAREIFFTTFREFNACIEGLNRHRDEAQFRFLREQYVLRLQDQLQAVAVEIIAQHSDKTFRETLSQNLFRFVQDYVYQFVQKIRAL